MSSPTIYIAVQCYHCSTMQVKQKKKSSNWTCVVCNQKQSVRKVFAQGYMAKDIRKIVQSFNMSRKFSDEQNESLTAIAPPSDAGVLEDQQRKRRSDWNEYLETEDVNKEKKKEKDGEEEEGDEFGPKIVTELPNELFKKPKLQNCGRKIDENSYKPVFSKRNVSQGKEGKKKHQTAAKVISPGVWCDFMMRDSNKEPRRTTQSEPKVGMKKGSKWDAYITNDENNFKAKNSTDGMDQCGRDIWETMVDDHKVEDDIHPDFM